MSGNWSLRPSIRLWAQIQGNTEAIFEDEVPTQEAIPNLIQEWPCLWTKK